MQTCIVNSSLNNEDESEDDNEDETGLFPISTFYSWVRLYTHELRSYYCSTVMVCTGGSSIYAHELRGYYCSTVMVCKRKLSLRSMELSQRCSSSLRFSSAP